MAARRSEPSEAVRHREGVSRKRSGPHHDDRASRTSDRSATSSSTSIVSAGAANTKLFVPLDLHESSANAWQIGVGDIGAAYKHVLYDSLSRGSILSAGGEFTLPTGSASKGLGKGVAMFEAFGTVSQVLPRDGFLHAHTGIEVPADAEQAAKETFWRLAVGKSFMQNRWGRAWSPMVEILGARELEEGSDGRVGRAAAAAGEPQHAAARAAQYRRAHAALAAARAADERPRLSAVGLVRRRILLGMVTRCLFVASRRGRWLMSAMYAQRNPHTEIFATSDQCMACHNGLRTPSGEDVSIGASWRASMMANSSRDPYWQAGVRREVLDHPAAAAGDSGRVRDVPHADVAHRGAAQRASKARCSITCPSRTKAIGPIVSRTTASPARCAIRSPIRISARPRALPAATSFRRRRGVVRRPPGRPMFGPFKIERGHDDHHAIGDGLPADRSRCTCGSPSCARRATRS